MEVHPVFCSRLQERGALQCTLKLFHCARTGRKSSAFRRTKKVSKVCRIAEQLPEMRGTLTKFCLVVRKAANGLLKVKRCF